MTMPNRSVSRSAAAAAAAPSAPVFQQNSYMVRRKVLKLFGGAFHVYDESGTQVLAYSKMKAFKLKEDIRLYTGEDMSQEILTIQARQIIDFGSSYDVSDPRQGKVGALRRKGLKSIVRDEWLVLDAHDREIGLIQEDSGALAILRRLIDMMSIFIPQKYVASIGGAPAATYQQNHNPFVYKLTVTLTGANFDRRLALASAILLAAVEGKQS